MEYDTKHGTQLRRLALVGELDLSNLDSRFAEMLQLRIVAPPGVAAAAADATEASSSTEPPVESEGSFEPQPGR